MLSTSAASLLASLVAILVAVYAFQCAIRAARYCESENVRSKTLKTLAEHETVLTELTDSYDALLTSHKRLRSRYGMRRLRDENKQDALPDPQTDPAGYKAAMRKRLANGGTLDATKTPRQ